MNRNTVVSSRLGAVTRCTHCGLAIHQRIMKFPASAPFAYWAHFTEAAYFVGGYHKAEPMKWMRAEW